MQRLAYQFAEAAPMLIAFGPIAGMTAILAAWLASFRRAPIAA